MEWAMSEIRCPSRSPASYLAWASWWHSLDRHLQGLATEGAAPAEVAILERSDLWDRFLELVSRQASRAMVMRERAIEPMLRASRRDFADAARVARARITWLREARVEGVARPDARVAALTAGLLDALDEATGVGSRHFVV